MNPPPPPNTTTKATYPSSLIPSTETETAPPTIHSPYLHPLSPTINKWVPLLSHDIQLLRPVGIYLSNSKEPLYHYTNHPIKWVRITGVVVGIDEFWPRDYDLGVKMKGGEKGKRGGKEGGWKETGGVKGRIREGVKKERRIYTIDDSSGVCVECCALVDIEVLKEGNSLSSFPSSKHLQQLEKLTTSLTNTTSKQETATKAKHNEQQPSAQTPAIKWKDIDIGKVVKVKGVPSCYRGNMQIDVIKMDVIRGTDEEVRCWGEVTKFKREVLGRPWVVGREEEERLRRRAERRAERSGCGRGRDRERGRMGEGREKESEEERRKRKKLKQVEKEEKEKRDLLQQREAEEREKQKKRKERENTGLESKNMVKYPTLATRRRVAGKYPALGI